MTDPGTDTSLTSPPQLDQGFFGWTLLFSVLLHLILSGVLLLPGKRSGAPVSPVYFDLKLAAPATVARPQTKDESSPKAAAPVEAPPLVETPPSPPSELGRLQEQVLSSLKEAQTKPEAVQNSSIGLGMLNGYFGTFADGETLRDDIREYYFVLVRKVNEAWWVGGGASSVWVREAVVDVTINREGQLVSKQLVQSSGSREYDLALLAALERAQPLPTLPVGFPEDLFTVPLRFIPPLNLLVKGK